MDSLSLAGASQSTLLAFLRPPSSCSRIAPAPLSLRRFSPPIATVGISTGAVPISITARVSRHSTRLISVGASAAEPATVLITETSPRQESLDVGGGGGSEGGSGGGGGGGGDRGDNENDSGQGGEGEGKRKMSSGMSMSQKLTLGYAALVGVGGLIGYIKSSSNKSLIAGGSSALLLYLVYTQLPVQPVLASSLGLGLSAALLVVMGSRFRKSGKIFPAGVVSVVSLVMTAGYFHGILRSLHA